MGRVDFFPDADRTDRHTAKARRVADQSVSESEERFRDIADAAPVQIWTTDASASCTWFNKAVLEFIGRPMEEALGTGFLDFVHPEDRDRVARTFLEVHQRHEPVRVQFRARRHDGAWRVLDETAVARFAPDGTFMGFIGSCMDVTEQHAATEVLRENEEKLRLATETAGIGFWDFDVPSAVARPDARLKAMFGMAADVEATNEEYFALVHKDDRKRVTDAFAAALDPVKRPIYDVEYRVLGRDGIERWIAAKGRGFFDAEGRCGRVLGTAVDITARKRTEEALLRNEEQLRLATDFAEVGFWDVDLVSDAIYWSPRVKALLGMPPGAPASTAEFRASIHHDDSERIGAAIEAATDPARRAPYDVEYRAVGRSDGVVRWLAAKGRAIFDQQDRCVRMLGIVADVTARKRVEEQLCELNERLEQRVAERSAALEAEAVRRSEAEAGLRQAQKMEAIGNLTGGIAHDFNNLLQGVTGSFDLIRRKAEDPGRVRKWAEAGLHAADRGAKLTAQLLSFSRAQKLELKPLNVALLLSGTEELLARALGPSVRMRMDVEESLPAVLGDQTQLELAVLNLAINARDAMPNGGELLIVARRIAIAGGGELPDGDYVELSVTDSGEGMPPEVVARAFDPFFTTKEVGKGTGLGLSQVYGMACQAGGSARLRSAPGEGTTVCVFLPLAGETAETRAVHEIAPPMPQPDAARILVVDDDQDVRSFLADSLASLGHSVMLAENGTTGLEILGRTRPDLLIADYAMPGMTGTELAQRARDIDAALPVVFATGYAETSALDHAADSRTFVLRKPFHLTELQRTLAQALRPQARAC